MDSRAAGLNIRFDARLFLAFCDVFFELGRRNRAVAGRGHNLAQVLFTDIARGIEAVQTGFLIPVGRHISLRVKLRESLEERRGGRIARKDKDAEAAAVRGAEFGHLAGLCVPVANAAQHAIARDFLDFGVVFYRDFFVLFRGFRDLRGTGKIGLANQNGHMRGILCEEYRFLCCGKAAADHKDLAAGEKLAVAGRAVGNAVALIFRLARETDHARMRAGRENHTVGAEITLRCPDDKEAVFLFQFRRFGEQKFRAEIFRLAAHLGSQRLAAHRRGAGVVHNLGGNRNLAAELFLFQNEDAVAGSRKIETGGQPRRAAADDYRVIERSSLF